LNLSLISPMPPLIVRPLHILLPFVTRDEAQINFLESLHEASRNNVITWRIVDDDDRDAFAATVDGETLEVELLYVPGAPGHGSERGFVRVSGLKTYFTYAVGTRGYDIIMSMLSLHIFGWAEGTAGGLRSLARATQRVRALLQ
jgi:hypothetical protein